MKIRIKTNALKKTIYKLIIVVPSVSHRPEFMGIKIDAQENTIIFQARNEKMDLQMAESDKNNFNTFENGSILIKARTINEIVGKMSGEWIELTKVDENLVIVKEFNNADSHDHISKYEINLLNIDGFGEISFTNTPIFEFNINSNDFKNVINNVSYAGNENSPRIILQGIEFKMEDNKIKATATDTMRIATTEIDFNIEKEDAVILPIKVMREVIKIIEQENINFKFELGKVYISDGKSLIKTRYIEGKYPDVKKAYPEEIKNRLEISKNHMIGLLEKVTILNNQQPTNVGQVKMKISDKKMILESIQIEIGSAKVTSSEINWEGEENYHISFNPRFLFEAIKSLKNDQIIMEFNSSEMPFIVTDKDKKTRALILPFRT